jgi:hypothetical protein
MNSESKEDAWKNENRIHSNDNDNSRRSVARRVRKEWRKKASKVRSLLCVKITPRICVDEGITHNKNIVNPREIIHESILIIRFVHFRRPGFIILVILFLCISYVLLLGLASSWFDLLVISAWLLFLFLITTQKVRRKHNHNHTLVWIDCTDNHDWRVFDLRRGHGWHCSNGGCGDLQSSRNMHR